MNSNIPGRKIRFVKVPGKPRISAPAANLNSDERKDFLTLVSEYQNAHSCDRVTAMQAMRIYGVTGTGIDDLEERFSQVSVFFSEFVELKEEHINYAGLPMKFVSQDVEFSQKAVEFMGDNVICESTNVDKMVQDVFIGIVTEHLR